MKTNPFKVPEGYAERLQCVLSEKLESEKPERVPMWWRVAKPALLMACMFGIIFGMAAGIRSLTSKVYTEPLFLPNNSVLSLVEEGMLDTRFIEKYYDQIDLSEGFSESVQEEIIMDEWMEEEVIGTIKSSDIYNLY